MKNLRRLLKGLPKKYVKSLKKVYYKIKINQGSFKSPEAEFNIIDQFVKEGDRVIDIGANVGHYTLKLSSLVGKKGRVIAFEPVPETFEMLSSNVGHAGKDNVTLINAAVSNDVTEAKFSVPNENLYQSHMDEAGDRSVMAFPLKSFLPHSWTLAFVKIDAEGCDENIIRSEIDVLNRFRPIVMSEVSQKIAESLANSMENYTVLGFKWSHNRFLVPLEKVNLLKI
ncbi:FkbM family methyltransferase [uncultured Marinobacter sp.]|jgi:FkbM family methyltransferase|uniref:FkbM family methyltransferase n=1 Tax=uncultured Marinobacter sp. TaxID=187379 RepID=UPI0030DAF0FD|tara:strand:+ start:49409 stop:50086 length:678 start_codon:yes stop_codon:yes gene_type:complete